MHGNRTRMRMELEKQRIEMERKREEAVERERRKLAVSQASSTMEVPTIQEATSASLEVPTDILQVRQSLSPPPHTYTHTYTHTGSHKAGQSYQLPRERDTKTTSTELHIPTTSIPQCSQPRTHVRIKWAGQWHG